MEVKKISVDGTITDLPDKKYGTLKEAVGGYIEMVQLGNGKTMIVNEDGQLENLPLNKKASIIAGIPIAGNVVIIQGNIDD